MPKSHAETFVAPYVVTNGAKFRITDIDPADCNGLKDKGAAAALLQEGLKKLAKLQETLYAQNTWSMLLIFQAMDAAGKDSTIKHVMNGVDPQGCQVYSFKTPNQEELDHDFLWRCACRLPERGRIGIFNRSYYEETLIVRVHPEHLAAQRLPAACIPKDIWQQRFDDINNFERYLSHNGVVIRKFFLHISKEEQKKRFLERLEMPEKNWKFSHTDVAERAHWDDYQHAYQEMIRHTSTKHSPWMVVPADHKWYTRLVVAAAIVDALEGLDLKFPQMDKSKKVELAAVEAALRKESGGRGRGK